MYHAVAFRSAVALPIAGSPSLRHPLYPRMIHEGMSRQKLPDHTNREGVGLGKDRGPRFWLAAMQQVEKAHW